MGETEVGSCYSMCKAWYGQQNPGYEFWDMANYCDPACEDVDNMVGDEQAVGFSWAATTGNGETTNFKRAYFRCTDDYISTGVGSVTRTSYEGCSKRFKDTGKMFVYYAGSQHCQETKAHNTQYNKGWKVCVPLKAGDEQAVGFSWGATTGNGETTTFKRAYFRCTDDYISTGVGSVTRTSYEGCSKRFKDTGKMFVYYAGSQHCQETKAHNTQYNKGWKVCVPLKAEEALAFQAT